MKEPISKKQWIKKNWILILFVSVSVSSVFYGMFLAPPEKSHHKTYQPADHSDSNSDQETDNSVKVNEPQKTNIFYDGSYHYIMETPNAYIYRAEIPGTDGGPQHSPTVCYITENKMWTNVSDGIYCIPAS